MKTIWAWHFNIKTASEANSSEHWTVKAKRHKKQKLAIKKILIIDKPNIRLPCKVSLTRLAPRILDAHDNLAVSMKYIVDAIADYLCPGKAAGRADDSKQITWAYDQKKGQPKEYGVFIQIESDTWR